MNIDEKTGMQRMIEDIRREVFYTAEETGLSHFHDEVMAAMASVPRMRFVPQGLESAAFDNGPLPIGYGQTISQPYIVALMSELLHVGSDSVVLEVGTGSGYQAAVLSQLVHQVYSLELVPELARAAADRLHQLGYHNVEVRQGDGYRGWAEHAPYDGIIVTAAAPHIPHALIEQLRVGARLVIPVGDAYGSQRLMVVTKQEGRADEQTVLPVAFVPLRHSPPDSSPTLH